MADPRGTNTPTFERVLSVDGSSIAFPGRFGDPTYPNHSGVVIDLQTTPTKNSTNICAIAGIRTRVMARVWSPTGALCHAAVYAVLDADSTVSFRVSPIVDFTSIDLTDIDLGDVLLDKGYSGYLRLWSDGVVL